MTHDKLRRAFATFGAIVYVSLPRFNTSGGELKGFAFIEFETPAVAALACSAYAPRSIDLHAVSTSVRYAWGGWKDRRRMKVAEGASLGDDDDAAEEASHAALDDERAVGTVDAAADGVSKGDDIPVSSTSEASEASEKRGFRLRAIAMADWLRLKVHSRLCPLHTVQSL